MKFRRELVQRSLLKLYKDVFFSLLNVQYTRCELLSYLPLQFGDPTCGKVKLRIRTRWSHECKSFHLPCKTVPNLISWIYDPWLTENSIQNQIGSKECLSYRLALNVSAGRKKTSTRLPQNMTKLGRQKLEILNTLCDEEC